MIILKSGTAHNCSSMHSLTTCWGWNFYGQTVVPESIQSKQIHDISLGVFNSCALVSTKNKITFNELECWGHVKFIYNKTKNIPQLFKFNSSKIALGVEHICILNSSKSIKCFGDNSFNQLSQPEKMCPTDSITAGDRHSCALTHGLVMCWGSDK